MSGLGIVLLASIVQIHGVALSLHYEDPAKGMFFDKMVNEISEAGATDISIVVQWSQPDVRADRIEPHERETPPDKTVRTVIRTAKSLGLRVTLFTKGRCYSPA